MLTEKQYDTMLEKARIQIEGFAIPDDALDAIGAGVKARAGGFESGGKGRPAMMKLRNGLDIPVVAQTEESPYALTYNDGRFDLLKRGEVLYADVTFEERPKFHDKLTSDGVPMRGLVGIVNRGVAALSAAPGCYFQANGEGCLFCNFYSGERSPRPRHTLQQTAEAVKAAFDEGVAWRVNYNGGVLANRREIDLYIESLQAIFEHFGTRDLIASVCIAAPTDFSQIDRLKDAGFTDLSMNLEIWDKNFFKTICPGKERLIGYDRWVEALEYGARVFGKGHVCTNFVTGIEPASKTLEGVRYLASVGVTSFPAVFQPTPDTAFDGHRAPTAKWNLDLHIAVTDILRENGFKLENTINTHAWSTTLFQDVWRIEDGLLPELADA
ncbi:MAG: radical SAM protein [Oscillospiraceae bacterium]|jgi:hypothetical protein|nr:radical SAM protein [Oscillospiraceae bacterium]